LLAVSTEAFVPVPLSHLAGAVSAVILFALVRLSAGMVAMDAARNDAA